VTQEEIHDTVRNIESKAPQPSPLVAAKGKKEIPARTGGSEGKREKKLPGGKRCSVVAVRRRTSRPRRRRGCKAGSLRIPAMEEKLHQPFA